MSKILVMNFLNEEGKKVAVRVNSVREDLSAVEVASAMDVIIANNIFTSTGGDLKYKDSAEIIDKTSTELTVK
ncbi:DUF2922 domain-containing protein [Clostridium sp. DJ247]|uniref:DUF2922 domain-containing protein n=1 Tax=Clostridium sp. DJ247 TaxID=2726188 RepID=UPI00162453B4|nr:DUF2922 domain-containing protein [Clostridium sp. DJ247]MBC2578858.1 DUF2922 domain-containing protein [Clostridium sp. DJ247]